MATPPWPTYNPNIRREGMDERDFSSSRFFRDSRSHPGHPPPQGGPHAGQHQMHPNHGNQPHFSYYSQPPPHQNGYLTSSSPSMQILPGQDPQGLMPRTLPNTIFYPSKKLHILILYLDQWNSGPPDGLMPLQASWSTASSSPARPDEGRGSFHGSSSAFRPLFSSSSGSGSFSSPHLTSSTSHHVYSINPNNGTTPPPFAPTPSFPTEMGAYPPPASTKREKKLDAVLLPKRDSLEKEKSDRRDFICPVTDCAKAYRCAIYQCLNGFEAKLELK